MEGLGASVSTPAGLAEQRQHLQALSSAYYAGCPAASDAAFDALKAAFEHDVEEATQLGTETSGLSLADAVGAPAAVAALAKAEHTAQRGGRLLSLAAVHSADEVRTWWQRNVEPHVREAGSEAAEVAVEPKVDGLTLRATYRDGVCVQVRRCDSCLLLRPGQAPGVRCACTDLQPGQLASVLIFVTPRACDNASVMVLRAVLTEALRPSVHRSKHP